MQRLAALLAGTWDMTLTYAPGPLAPEGGTGTGQETSRPGPGGLSLFIETTAGGPAGRYEAGGIIEWSATEHVYKLHWVSSLSHVGSYFDGTWVEEDPARPRQSARDRSVSLVVSFWPDSLDCQVSEAAAVRGDRGRSVAPGRDLPRAVLRRPLTVC
jgi:hypothetical protein